MKIPLAIVLACMLAGCGEKPAPTAELTPAPKPATPSGWKSVIELGGTGSEAEQTLAVPPGETRLRLTSAPSGGITLVVLNQDDSSLRISRQLVADDPKQNYIDLPKPGLYDVKAYTQGAWHALLEVKAKP